MVRDAKVTKVKGVIMTKETQSFEEMMQELEQIVQKLDNETVNLYRFY